ncbi:MAG: hypothetical protein IIC01_00885 [Planctomycetes bacterium]|nr:hypothetical protein [Planctomycetota bacterium]
MTKNQTEGRHLRPRRGISPTRADSEVIPTGPVRSPVLERNIFVTQAENSNKPTELPTIMAPLPR